MILTNCRTLWADLLIAQNIREVLSASVRAPLLLAGAFFDENTEVQATAATTEMLKALGLKSNFANWGGYFVSHGGEIETTFRCFYACRSEGSSKWNAFPKKDTHRQFS